MKKQEKKEILDSLKLKNELNPDIFMLSGTMIPEVRKKLLQISYDFYDFVNLDWVGISDIVLVGSMANYNWSKYSDIDVHVRIPFSEISNNKQLAEDLALTKKSLWKVKNDIELKGHDVEHYLENSEKDELKSSGVYSIIKDKWLNKPDKSLSKKKINMNRISSLIDKFNKTYGKIKNKYNKTKGEGEIQDDVSDFKDVIYKLRQVGLDKGGEFSEENLAFKAMRRSKMIDDLKDMKRKSYSNNISSKSSSSSSASNKKKDDDRGDSSLNKKRKKGEEDTLSKGAGRYIINGRKYKSLRDAEKETGIPKSTIQYRVKNDWPNFRELEIGSL